MPTCLGAPFAGDANNDNNDGRPIIVFLCLALSGFNEPGAEKLVHSGQPVLVQLLELVGGTNFCPVLFCSTTLLVRFQSHWQDLGLVNVRRDWKLMTTDRRAKPEAAPKPKLELKLKPSLVSLQFVSASGPELSVDNMQIQSELCVPLPLLNIYIYSRCSI